MTELIKAAELAARLQVTERFVKECTRATRVADPIPHLKLHRRAVLYDWNSPEMQAWLQRRKSGGRK